MRECEWRGGPLLTVCDVLRNTATRVPGRTAVIFRDRHLTYAQLSGAVHRLAGGLSTLGIGHGDRVALMAPNCDAFAICYHGIMRAGASVVPINPMFKAPEIAFILKDSEAKAALVHAALAPTLREAADLAAVEPALLSIGGEVEDALAMEAILDVDHEAFDPPAVAPGDIAAVLYTSGTTGRPKGAMLSHDNLVFDARASVDHFGFSPDDRILVVLPMFHAFAATVGLVIPACIGASIVALERFTPQGVFDAISDHAVTIFPGVPTMFAALLKAADALQWDFASLRACVSGGAPMPPALMEQFEAKFGVPVCEGDGPTECSPITSVNVLHKPRKPGTVGLPLPGVEVRAVDDHDEPVPCGEIGELVVRGRNVMVGYLNQPEATAEALRGGWFHTGDLGTVDEDGYVAILDRKKDMIIVGGLNVYPREVEDVLYEHPAIQAAAVIGVLAPLRGERVKAVIVRRPGHELSESDVLAHCRGRLANYKLPKLIEFAESLPLSPTGKVLRRELRDPHG